jgi:ATP-dependent Clp protease ATP-binding subunit ClpA
MLDLGPLTQKFSESGQKVIVRAVEESKRREHNFLSVEHIFYALTEAESEMLTKALQSNGVNEQMVTSLLEQELSKSHEYASHKSLFITNPTCDLFTRAMERARAHGRQETDSFDLFIALFDDPVGTPAKILRRLGADPDRFANFASSLFLSQSSDFICCPVRAKSQFIRT